jgi:hypothetical protein
MNERSDHWVSLHVYHSSLDEITASVLGPILRQLVSRRIARRFFFLRHWEGGRHARVRIESPTANVHDLSAPIMAAIDKALCPSPISPPSDSDYRTIVGRMRRIEFAAGLGSATVETCAEPLQPFQSVRVCRYQLDVSRYSSRPLALLSRAHCCRSADLSLETVSLAMREPSSRTLVALHLLGTLPDVLGSASGTDGRPELLRRLQAVGGDGAMAEQIFVTDGYVPYVEQRSNLLGLRSHLRRGDCPDYCTYPLKPAIVSWSRLLRRTLTAATLILRRSGVRVSLVDFGLDLCHLMLNSIGIPLLDEMYLRYLLMRTLEES